MSKTSPENSDSIHDERGISFLGSLLRGEKKRPARQVQQQGKVSVENSPSRNHTLLLPGAHIPTEEEATAIMSAPIPDVGQQTVVIDESVPFDANASKEKSVARRVPANTEGYRREYSARRHARRKP